VRVFDGARTGNPDGSGIVNIAEDLIVIHTGDETILIAKKPLQLENLRQNQRAGR
jgi:hypothetical protein